MRIESIIVLVLVAVCVNASMPDGVTKSRLREQVLSNNPFPRFVNSSNVDQYLNVFLEHAKIDRSGFNVEVDDVYRMENFPCATFGPSNPSDVNKLKPSDIGIVMAMGDSITAAFGAGSSSIFTVFTEYRGRSWSIGGEKNYDSYTTIPNFIKKYNPNVKGFSIGNGKESSSNAKLNVAVTGAVSKGLHAQVQDLVNKLVAGNKNGDWNFQQDWKLLTIFIGGNNLCDYCNDKNANSPDQYSAEVEAALDLLLNSVPRVFINLVPSVDVTKLGVLSSGLCSLLHPWECPCAQGSGVAPSREAFNAYAQKLKDLAAKSKYQGHSNFKISVQPFFIDTDVPYNNGKPDTSYFAPDCFHFSTKAHVAAGVALWNNMFEDVSVKETRWYLGEQPKCPSENEYIR